MAATEVIARDRQSHVVHDSIREKRHLVLTRNSSRGWSTFKAAFVSGCEKSGQLTVNVLLPEPPSDETLPNPGDTLGATFRVGHKKCMFHAELLSSQLRNDRATFILKWPDLLQQLRRRAYERIAPPRDQVVAVRFWMENDPHGRPGEARSVRHGQLEDISCGGLRLKVANAADLTMGATYKCALAPRPGKPSLVLDGILRHREAVAHGRASLGIQFVGMETTKEGMKTLDRLARVVSYFQRAKSRPVPRRGSKS